MQAFPLVALELPVKLLVWQDGDALHVAYARCRRSRRRYGIMDGAGHSRNRRKPSRAHRSGRVAACGANGG